MEEKAVRALREQFCQFMPASVFESEGGFSRRSVDVLVAGRNGGCGKDCEEQGFDESLAPGWFEKSYPIFLPMIISNTPRPKVIVAHMRPPYMNMTMPMSTNSPPQAMAMRASMVISLAILSLFLTIPMPQCLQREAVFEIFFPQFGHFIVFISNKKRSSGVVL